MLGGQVKSSATAATGAAKALSGPGAALPPGQDGVAARSKAVSRPQDVTEFLAKGEGAALLPRRTQVRTVACAAVCGFHTFIPIALRLCPVLLPLPHPPFHTGLYTCVLLCSA